MPGGAGEEHDDVSRDDDWHRLEEKEEEQGEEKIGAMANRVEEEVDEEQDVDIGEEEIVLVVDDEEEEENIETVDVDGEEEENVDVDGEEENGEVVRFGEHLQQQHQHPKFGVVVGEEDNVDEDQPPSPPQSSKPSPGSDDPLSSATNTGVLNIFAATASSNTHLNTADDDESASHERVLRVHQDVVVPKPPAMIKQADLLPSTTTGIGADLASPTTNEVKASASSSPFDHLKEPPAKMEDDKSLDIVLLRKNSIQDSKVNLGTEMENVLQNLASRRATTSASDALELNQTELKMKNETEEEEDVTRTSGNRDQLMPDAAAAGGTVVVVVQDREENMAAAAEKDTEPSGSSNHDPRAFDGLNALTSAIDIGQALDALAKLQPKQDNGTADIGGGGSEAAAGNSSGGLELEKTELEREMALYEASEREEEAKLLASMRSSDQSMHGGDSMMKDMMMNDRKRASESIPNEARKKRGKRAVLGDEVKEEEDVCFICFDGGDLVLCDRRSCPKAYHLSCIGRDAAFFQKKGAWICGWHFCSICTKPANFQCYTCPTAYCSGCLDQADFHCVRHRKGLCEECWPIVQMIENKETVNLDEGVEVDFTDQETYEGLFKVYWEDLKQRWSLSAEELDKDGKGAGGSAAIPDDSDEDKVDPEDYFSESGDDEDEEQEEDEEDMEGLDVAKRRKRRRGKAKTLLAEGVEGDPEAGFGSEDDDGMELGEEDADEQDDDEKTTPQPREFDGWASKELIEFVKYMDEDPKKPLSRFEVTKLLWSYIKTQKLQDPRKKSQIQCDDRLRTIFGKKIVGQIEMYKHLQSHFAPKGWRRAGRQVREEQAGLEDGMDADGSVADEKFSRVKDIRDRRRRRKPDEDKVERPNVDEFASVTPKNIGLIYLRRQLLEELLDDPDFDSKVCNTFVRIRVPGMQSKSEMCYRLVQVVGTRSQAEHYKAGRKVTNYVLEILNLQKREDVTVDLVSNHDFSEEECQRLRQSIKCGFIKTLTVGDIEEKARSLQEAKVNDWFETERQRLVNLRDRASEKGRKKELRECVEKLQELNSPAFRAAKLQARPEVTADPRMDPNYESDGNDDHARDGRSKILDKSTSPGILPVSILKGGQIESSRVDWEGVKIKQSAWADTNRSSKEGDRLYDSGRSSDKLSYGRPAHSYVESAKERGYDERERGWGMEQQNDGTGDAGWMGNGRSRGTPAQKWNEKVDLSINVDARSVDARSARGDYRGNTGLSTTPVFDTKADWPSRRESAPPATPSLAQAFPVPASNVLSQAAIEAGDKEKIWHYMDPTGMVQGPFAMEQLRKWNTTGYFPEDLRIWKTTQTREESILLTDALAGRFQKEREPWGSASRVGNPVVASIQEEIAQALTTSSTLPFNNPALKSAEGWRENGGASSWTDRAGSGDVGRSSSWGGADMNQNNRTFGRDAETGPTVPLRDTSIDMKWKPGPASGAFDSYGRSAYSSESRSGRADAAAKFDPANWGSRSAGGRPERESWGSSAAPANEGGGYSSFGRRSSLGRGSNYRDSGGKWNPDSSSGQDISRSSSRSATRAARKDIPCRFHQKGYCKRGDSCDFWHG